MFDRITVLLPADGLLFHTLTGTETLSRPFVLTAELLATDARIDRHALLGKPVTFTLPTDGLMNALSPRYLNGKITRVAVRSQELSGTRYAVYQLTVEPDLWPMRRDRNLRIFQSQTVPQIVQTLLKEYGVSVETRLAGSYRVWEYCVQYQESSLDFISRLMELEGIYYFFRHEADKHTLVLCDAPDQHQAFPGYETIAYHVTPSGGVVTEEGISQWSLAESVTPGIYSTDDYDFRKPNAWMLQARQNPASPVPGSVDVYDWPGHFVDHSHGESYARIRQEVWQAEHHSVSGSGTATGIAPGFTFSIINAPHFSDNGEYLVTSATYDFAENSYASGDTGDSRHNISFTVLPSSVTYRTPPETPWPKTHGPQTAKVVGPKGESIWTDRYGRVKVKFHWDRLAKGDDTSSCWVRVSSAWAGQGFGGVQIPRVNDEVVVDFINGDPDRPLIIGRVYNEASMPPWALPAAATQMGFLSRSKDGTADTANALRFEDKAGEEQVWLHAEKNMDTEVENNETHSVGSNRTKTIGGNETTEVKKNRTETVDQNETITVHQNRTETVDGNETITVHSNRTETVDQNEKVRIGQNQSVTINGNQTLKVDRAKAETIALASMLNVGLAQNTNIGAAYMLNVGGGWMTNVGGMQAHHVGMKYSLNTGRDMALTAGTTAEFSAEDKITLVCGESMIVLEHNGTITISANKIKLVGEKVIDIDGTQIDIN
ncbi:type VI secretion system tip protein TssI/VgrG [Pantoea sp.]|uniref:type VI secretion system Vgr family protein n=4 Tax=unclassified Pantoea TaxID=2630326 RepID=UPI0028A8ED5C|nr:type VI secretion system tip protein TssI/VgrG [Pantoea sp.]